MEVNPEVTNPGQNGDQQMFVLCDLTRVARHGKEEGRSQMIGWDPKTEVAPSSRQRKKEMRKSVCWTEVAESEPKANTERRKVTRTRRSRIFKPVLKKEHKDCQPVKEEILSTGIHRNKISKLRDCISLYPIIYPLSLSS